MRIYLTGATGLVGSHLAERLRARGDEVVAMVRETSDTRFLEAIGVEPRSGDLESPPARLAEAMRGCDAVVHAAAVLYARGLDAADYQRVNVEGTGRILDAAALAGVPRMLHVSSIAVYGAVPPGAPPRTEERWLEGAIPAGDPYPASKRAAECAVWERHAPGRLAITTVRPGIVWGERDRLFTPMLCKAASLRILPLPGGGDTVPPLVYAGNVARAVALALHRPETEGRAYNLASDYELTLRELLLRLGDRLGRRPRTLSVPAPVVRAAAATGDALGALARRGPRRQLRRAARTVLRDHPYVMAAARAQLDWDVLVDLDEALDRMAAWCREQAAGR